MRTLVLVTLIAAVVCLAAPAPSEALCFTNTVASTYVFTLAGVNSDGLTISHVGVAALGVTDANGFGFITGTLLMNERGFPTTVQDLTGDFQLDANCFITIRIEEFFGGRLDSLLGYVSQNGGMIIFGSPFDPAVQLSGVATRAQ